MLNYHIIKKRKSEIIKERIIQLFSGKTSILKPVKLFFTGNLILKTKQLFLLSKPKPAIAPPVQKIPSISNDFESLSNNALIQFAKNVIFCMDCNIHYTQTKNDIVLLLHSVIDMEDAITQCKIKNDAVNFNTLKIKRRMVLHHLKEISKIVKATATFNSENARIIISESGFGIKK